MSNLKVCRLVLTFRKLIQGLPIGDQHPTAVTVKASSSFPNTTSGFTALLAGEKHCKEDLPVLYLMEATGIYYEPLAWFLYQKASPSPWCCPIKPKSIYKAWG
jgi:hypothetical protein